MSKFAILHEMN